MISWISLRTHSLRLHDFEEDYLKKMGKKWHLSIVPHGIAGGLIYCMQDRNKL